MAGRISLARAIRPPVVSLVPLIDVLLILLVFFMVTSSYLDLDMIPAVQPEQGNAGATDPAERGETVLVRLGADGIPVVSGQPVPVADLPARLGALDPDVNLVILPSGAAQTQGLVTLLDAAATAGITRLRVIRLEAQP
jgi:biopolymer transport protein ExbD